MAEAHLLVPPERLTGLVPEPTVLDVRWALGRDDGHEQYRAGHVPGAVYVDLETELADPPGPPPHVRGRHPLPSPARFRAAAVRWGVDAARPVVVYDDAGGGSASRAWWLLRDAGHRDVRLLDGGWSGWTSSGGAVETGEVVPAPGSFHGEPGQLPVLDAAEAARVAAEGVLVDARAPARYRGEVEPIDPVAGHVPGAVNVPATAHLAPGGRFRPLPELAALYDGVDGAVEAGVYCGSGITATLGVLALALLGVDAALYPGSWSAWASDPDRPVETGSQQS